MVYALLTQRPIRRAVMPAVEADLQAVMAVLKKSVEYCKLSDDELRFESFLVGKTQKVMRRYVPPPEELAEKCALQRCLILIMPRHSLTHIYAAS